MHQFRRHRQAISMLQKLWEHPENALVIHYSCESFADRPQGRSPRVTSIAVRNLATAHTVSFSIHQMAESRRISSDKIVERYDELERGMLKEFYDFVSKHSTQTWVHWNMRDINFGFPALAHRYKVLGGVPTEIPHERLFDVSRVLVMKYGVGYMKHPRLENLINHNDITMLNFLSGAEEAEAFEKREYYKLHQSTLRKVDNIANIVERAVADGLKTLSKWSDRTGISLREIAVVAQNHWLITLFIIFIIVIGLIGSFASILGISLKDCRGSIGSHAPSALPSPSPPPSSASSFRIP
jgi:hypothetical protein